MDILQALDLRYIIVTVLIFGLCWKTTWLKVYLIDMSYYIKGAKGTLCIVMCGLIGVIDLALMYHIYHLALELCGFNLALPMASIFILFGFVLVHGFESPDRYFSKKGEQFKMPNYEKMMEVARLSKINSFLARHNLMPGYRTERDFICNRKLIGN